MHFNKTLQHTATHCSTLEHTETHCCNTFQHAIILMVDCTLPNTAIHCNSLQLTGIHCCNTLHHTDPFVWRVAHCHTLQHTATHRNSLQLTAATHLTTRSHLYGEIHSEMAKSLEPRVTVRAAPYSYTSHALIRMYIHIDTYTSRDGGSQDPQFVRHHIYTRCMH